MSKSQSEKTKVKIGDPAPLFSLPDGNGKEVKLEEYIGKKSIVLYFYPKDYTSGCTAEACSFRDRYELFLKAGAEVIGISSDSSESHTEFAATYKLPFVLLSDEKSKVRKLYKVGSTFGIIPGRVTYIIDKEGIIRHIFSSQFNPKKHIDEALQVLDEMNKG
ncbi:MAG: peroxiredoxin [Candidatus Heimdallarchaeota archaeon]